MGKQHVRVLVVGGGVGGRAVAAFLRQSGYTVVVDTRTSGSNAGVYVAGNGVRMLSSLGREDLLTSGVAIDSMEVRDLKGELISTEDFQEDQRRGAGPVGIRRNLLEGRLRAVAGAMELPEFEVEEIDTKGAIVKTPQGKESFDLVVAADGPTSPLRQRFFEPPFREASRVVLRFLSRCQGDAKAARILGNGVTLTHYPVGPGERAAVAVVPPELGNVSALRAALGPAGAALLDGLEAGSLHLSPLVEGLAPRWGKGSLVLLGSAAHALHPTLGQGAAMAIEDARALQVALDGEGSVSAALSAFEKLRGERVTAVYKAGWEQAEAAKKGQLTTSFRGLLHRMLPALSPERKLHALLLDGGDLERLLSHRPELAPLTPESRDVLRFLIKIGQVDGRFDETERAFAKASLLEIGHSITAKDLEDLEAETRFRGAAEIVRPFQGHSQEFREHLIKMGVLLAAASGRITADEHKALRDASAALHVTRETLDLQVKEAIEARDLERFSLG